MDELSIVGERRDSVGGPHGRAGTGERADIVLGTDPLPPPDAPHHRGRDERTSRRPAGDPCPTALTETGATS